MLTERTVCINTGVYCDLHNKSACLNTVKDYLIKN